MWCREGQGLEGECLLLLSADIDEDCTHEEGSGEVVCEGRQGKGKASGDPEHHDVAELAVHQVHAEYVEDLQLLHGGDVCHRHQQEHEDLRGWNQRELALEKGAKLGRKTTQ